MVAVSEPLRDLLKGAAEYVRRQDIMLTDRNKDGNVWTYELIVGDYGVTIKVFRDGETGPYRKQFTCDCSHASLFGIDKNIPCKHIFAAILFLGMGEVYGQED